MARSVRMVSAQKGGAQQIGDGSFVRFQAGSMGAAPIIEDTEPLQPFESPIDKNEDWQQELMRREEAEGLPDTRYVAQPPADASVILPGKGYFASGARLNPVVEPVPPVDLTGIPETFGLQVERKADGTWKVTAPDVHVGLFVSDRDLCAALAKAPGVLANIVRLDGVMPQPKTRRKK